MVCSAQNRRTQLIATTTFVYDAGPFGFRTSHWVILMVDALLNSAKLGSITSISSLEVRGYVWREKCLVVKSLWTNCALWYSDENELILKQRNNILITWTNIFLLYFIEASYRFKKRVSTGDATINEIVEYWKFAFFNIIIVIINLFASNTCKQVVWI